MAAMKMGTRTKDKEFSFWNLLGNFEGDKVIWAILFFLMMISILSISSSTSLLAISSRNGSTRLSYAMEQVVIAACGLVLIWLCCKLKKIGPFRLVSRFGFMISLMMLVYLDLHIKLPFLESAKINDAYRCIKVFGFQLHVFEFVKVLMIMYVAWAMDILKKGETSLADSLAAMNPRLSFMNTETARVVLYVLLPIGVTIALIAPGSNSSALFIGVILVVTAIIGGLRWKYVMGLAAAGIVMLSVAYGIQYTFGLNILPRLDLVGTRLRLSTMDPLDSLANLKPGSQDFRNFLDATMQPVSAKVAVSEGGLFGKGPGNSTQRYVVSVMYGDYMYSFIVEEYGLIGGLIILILYGSLLARGALLVRNLDSTYAKTMIAGMVILVSGQALMHILINVDLFPLTGQPLPMISHGNSSFLAFSIVFGIILSVSKLATKKMQREMEAAEPIIVHGDEIRDSLDDLDNLETTE